jgi:hypothetical protein
MAASFRVYAEFDTARTIRTGIAIANPGAAPANVRFELLDLLGQPLVS